ncbi:MAG: hypothetical protein HY541_06310 [Deltaproteobacteria bacterium]|nr:hypothetical protein [Deltaproteobacteria bacterium]
MKNIKQFLLFIGLIGAVSGCGALFSEADDSDSSSSLSAESDEETMVSAAIDSLNSVTNSSESASGASYSALTTDSSTLSASTLSIRNRFRCDIASQADETFSCDNSDGSVERSVTFTDCELTYSPRDAVLNGGFTSTIENGGDGLCEASDTIDFAKMVMGRDDEDDVHQDAVHEHVIDDSGMVHTWTWTNDEGEEEEVVLTVTGSHMETFSNPVDEDEDGSAESVEATIEKSINRVQTIGGETTREVTVFTTAESFPAQDADGVDITVEPSLPVHEITIDEDTGRVSGRTIAEGNLIVDNEGENIRMIFSVGEEGLEFDDGTTCGPVSGTLSVVGYELGDDGTVGAEVGTGEVVFEDGEVESATFDGISLNPQPRPCN